MLDCDAVYERLIERGIGAFFGVPDSLLRHLCACIAARAAHHVIAASEGNALAMAVGHHVGTGELALVYLQNSGHGNLVNPLLSLADPSVYGVPVVLAIGWRGRPGGPPDEAQHRAQGAATEALLRATGTPFRVLPADTREAETVVDEVIAEARRARRPVALLVPEGTFAPWRGPAAEPSAAALTREGAIGVVLDACPESAVIVSTTGKASRELFELRRARAQGPERDLLVVGSMGHASAVALGLALARPDRPVWCLDGDGAALMHLGAVASIGAERPPNLTHVLLNNGAHDSVGGQPTAGFDVDLGGVARASGYATVTRVDDRPSLGAALAACARRPGPHFVEVRISVGARADLGRPDVPPQERLRALRRFLGQPVREP